MAEVLLLGTGAALSEGGREPTCVAIRGERTTVLVDCGANPVAQLQRLGVPLESLDRLILTHLHPDHVAGFPMLVMMLWLAGRKASLPVHGPPDTVKLARQLLGLWDTSRWTGLYEIEWHELAMDEGTSVAVTDEFEITSAPGVHSVPVVGLRVLDVKGGGTMAYGADGEPSDGVRGLAAGVDLLIHEATGPFAGHSTAAGAARLAREAGAKRLVLVHLAPQREAWERELAAAQEVFGDGLVVGEDGMRMGI